MEIMQGVPWGIAEDRWGVDRPIPDLIGGRARPSGVGLSLGLSVACRARGVLVVRVIGEVDMLTAPLLEQCVREQLAQGLAHLVMDLDAVGYLGAAGLGTLLAARDLALSVGSGLHLVVMRTRAVARPLAVTGLLPLFQVYSTLAEALAELTGDRVSPPVRDGLSPRC